MYYQKHIFICTNQKDNGKKCCAEAGAEDMFLYLKSKLKEMGLAGPGQYRVSRAGCLGRCSIGPNIVIYPEGTWHSFTSREDVDRLIEDLDITS